MKKYIFFIIVLIGVSIGTSTYAFFGNDSTVIHSITQINNKIYVTWELADYTELPHTFSAPDNIVHAYLLTKNNARVSGGVNKVNSDAVALEYWRNPGGCSAPFYDGLTRNTITTTEFSKILDPSTGDIVDITTTSINYVSLTYVEGGNSCALGTGNADLTVNPTHNDSIDYPVRQGGTGIINIAEPNQGYNYRQTLGMFRISLQTNNPSHVILYLSTTTLEINPLSSPNGAFSASYKDIDTAISSSTVTVNLSRPLPSTSSTQKWYAYALLYGENYTDFISSSSIYFYQVTDWNSYKDLKRKEIWDTFRLTTTTCTANEGGWLSSNYVASSVDYMWCTMKNGAVVIINWLVFPPDNWKEATVETSWDNLKTVFPFNVTFGLIDTITDMVKNASTTQATLVIPLFPTSTTITVTSSTVSNVIGLDNYQSVRDFETAIIWGVTGLAIVMTIVFL